MQFAIRNIHLTLSSIMLITNCLLKLHVMFDTQGIHLETLSSTVNHKGDFKKNVSMV